MRQVGYRQQQGLQLGLDGIETGGRGFQFGFEPPHLGHRGVGFGVLTLAFQHPDLFGGGVALGLAAIEVGLDQIGE